MPKTQVAIIGAGPAGLMAAEVLAGGGAGVTIYDAMPSVGRKFLMAGRGGLNLTHSVAGIFDALRQSAATACNHDRSLSASQLARMERSTGAADLHRLERPGFSNSVQGLAAAAGMAPAA
jgi:predicted flavoprotein YhiN